MAERRFKLELQSGCLVCEATGVRVQGEDSLWRYWIEFDERCIAGFGEFPPTRAGHARLKACAVDQFESLVHGRHRSGMPGDIQ